MQGGFLSAPAPVIGGPVRPGTGAFVRFVQPAAIAVRDNELVVVDSGAGRVYRCDIALNALTPIAGAPATPLTRVALGADLSAFVLDTAARRVLRFARDGRLLQTFRTEFGPADPADFALARNGASLYVADRTLAQVSVINTAGATAIPLRVMRGDVPVGGGAVAVGQYDLYLLDTMAGVVHRVDRDGAIRASFGQSQLTGAAAVAVDRYERVFVAEPAAGNVKVFENGVLTRTLAAAALGVQRVGAIAVDGDQLAVADAGTGQVAVFRLREPR